MNTIYKDQMPENGQMITTKIQVKAFKYADDMHKFLNKQTDNRWGECKSSMQSIKKSGFYVVMGGEYWNVKQLAMRGIYR
tara:strand:- start:182 stop:421 length:240 start_codon:yes stop_codon:yes gene_type:complete